MLIPKFTIVFMSCRGKYSKKDIIRFSSKFKIDKMTKCWLWIGGNKRYGEFEHTVCFKNKRSIQSHIVSYEMFNNISIPNDRTTGGAKKWLVCHKCNNSRCVNPDHLYLGTDQDNMNDMVNSGRQNKASGEKHGNSKFKLIQIKEIRHKYNNGKYTMQNLADQYNTTPQTICKIINNQLWYDHNYTKTRLR